VLMCFRSRDPTISLEPVVQGSVEGSAEATRDDVEDDARAVAEWFEHETENAWTFHPAAAFPPLSVIPIINGVPLFVDLDLTSVVVI
jgi:hypothetical protein